MQIPGWTYIKKYKTDRILEDLQVYRIATGQVNSKDYAAVLEKYGWWSRSSVRWYLARMERSDCVDRGRADG